MEKILYYRDKNNEIHEMKLTSVIIQIGGRTRDVSQNKYYVERVIANVAGMGVLSWTRNNYDNSLYVANIYDTVEKAIHGHNINTIKLADRNMGVTEEDLFRVRWSNAWDISAFDLDFVIPDHIFRVVDKDALGMEYVYYRTWIWDGVQPKEKGCLGVGAVGNIHNSYRRILYDLINKKCIYNDSIIGYKTREECVRANSVKIHRF